MRLGRWSEVRQLTGLMDRERQARLWIEGALSLLGCFLGFLQGLIPRPPASRFSLATGVHFCMWEEGSDISKLEKKSNVQHPFFCWLNDYFES